MYPSIRLSVYPSIRLSVYPSIRPSVHPSIRPSVHPSIRLSVYPSIRLSVYPSIRLSVYPSIRLSDDDFITPKQSVKPPHVNNRFEIPLSNRFDQLNLLTKDDVIVNKITKVIEDRNATHVNRAPKNNNRTNLPNKKKTAIFSDSMAKQISYREFNKHTPNHQSYIKSFSGANCKLLNHYIGPNLKDQAFDTAVLHIGTNDVSPRPYAHALKDDEILTEIEEMATKCKTHGVKNVVISGIITRYRNNNERRRIAVNRLIQSMCNEKGYHYVKNDNVFKADLKNDDVHLNERGISKFANNLIGTLNNLPH